MISADLDVVTRCVRRLAASGEIPRVALDITIDLASHLEADLGIDSVGLMALTMAIEDECDVTFDANDEQLEVETVADVLAALARARDRQ
jgi:acyl carrier protein